MLFPEKLSMVCEISVILLNKTSNRKNRLLRSINMKIRIFKIFLWNRKLSTMVKSSVRIRCFCCKRREILRGGHKGVTKVEVAATILQL